MADILFINEEFYKKNVSHKQAFDTSQIISAIRLVQKTNLVSIISVPIYDSFQSKLLGNIELTAGEQKLFESIQLFLAVKVAEESLDTSDKESESNSDASHLSYRSKCRLMEARIVRDIKRDSDLLALAQTATDEFDDEEMSQAGGFYFL